MPFINESFYMNPAYGRGVEFARLREQASRRGATDHQDDNAHWVTINGQHVLILDTQPGQEYHRHSERQPLPASGQASVYADSFDGKKTANGATFHQDAFTAALLPRDRWHAVPLGTRVELTHGDKRVVVEINDRGAGDRDPHSARALDISRAAASALTGQHIDNDRDARKVGLIGLDGIRVVPANTPLGPVRPLEKRQRAQESISSVYSDCRLCSLRDDDR